MAPRLGALSIDANPGGISVQYQSVPMFLRVCVECRAAQLFAAPAAVYAVAQLHQTPFHSLDATPPPPNPPDTHRWLGRRRGSTERRLSW